MFFNTPEPVTVLHHFVRPWLVVGHLVQGEAGDARREQRGQVHDSHGAGPPGFLACKIGPAF